MDAVVTHAVFSEFLEEFRSFRTFVEEKFTCVEQRLDRLEQRMDRLEEEVQRLKLVSQTTSTIMLDNFRDNRRHNENFRILKRQLDQLNKKLPLPPRSGDSSTCTKSPFSDSILTQSWRSPRHESDL
jgi:hypothetical protein